MMPDRELAPIPGGTFVMGSDHHYPEERPAQPHSVDPFEMSATTSHYYSAVP